MKTLKDIKGIYSNGSNQLGESHTNTDDLRKEAIKWYKKLSDDGDSNDDSKFSADGYTCNVMDWIKHFFNITDEELK